VRDARVWPTRIELGGDSLMGGHGPADHPVFRQFGPGRAAPVPRSAAGRYCRRRRAGLDGEMGLRRSITGLVAQLPGALPARRPAS